MDEWRFRDTLGVLLILAVTLAAARSLDGIAQALVALVGVVIALLWIGKFFLEGYADGVASTSPRD